MPSAFSGIINFCNNMKKLYFIIIIFLFKTIMVFSQNTFFKAYPTEYQEYAYEVIQANDNSYIIVGKRGTTPTYTEVNALAMRIDVDGELLNEVVLEDENRTYFFIIDKAPNCQDQFLLIGSKDSITKEGMNSSLNICIADIDLNILSINNFHTLTNHRIGPWKHAMVDDSTMCLLIQDYDLDISPSVAQFIVSEIKLPGDSIRSFSSGPPNHNHIPQDILFLPQKNEFRVFYFGGLFEKDIFVKILHLDRNLNYDTVMYAPPHTITSVCATAFTDTSNLITATASNPELYVESHVIQIYELDESSDTIKGTYFYNHPDTNLYAGLGTNTAISNSTIFTTGIYNTIPLQYPWQSSPTWLQITLLDFDFTIKSQYFYGGDALYYPFCIISTDDGGVLVTGITWDYNIPNNQQHDIFALKLNSDGQIVNIPKDATWEAGEAIVYPNPAGDVVNVDFSMLYSTATFSLTNISGKTAFVKQLTTNRQSVDISSVPAGTYVFRIFNKKGLDERGKLVVE